MPARLDAGRGRNSSGMHMTQTSLTQRRDELSGEMVQLQDDVEELRKLVNTLLTIIMEEADGVQSGAAPTIPNQPKRGYCM
jgi:hypothetical protein